MKSSLSLTALGLAAVLIGYSLPAIAGDGHDHGDAAPAATGTALPRFAAVSENCRRIIWPKASHGACDDHARGLTTNRTLVQMVRPTCSGLTSSNSGLWGGATSFKYEEQAPVCGRDPHMNASPDRRRGGVDSSP